METARRPLTRSAPRTVVLFTGIFLALYIAAFVFAEHMVARSETQSAFQKLLPAQGEQVDWLVLGASHALPLAYGDVPARLQQDTGQSMMVLAEIGAGPLYSRFVFEQALHDLDVKHLIYVADSFAFGGEEWNEARVADRKLLRQTPLRPSTAQILAGLVADEGVDPRALLDYLTGFSKLNPADRFSQGGWRGAADFDRSFRPSRHAVSARIAYLYPKGTPEAKTVEHYLDSLDGLFDLADAAGVEVLALKLPVPKTFRDSLPGEAAFDAVLRGRLTSRGIVLHDLSEAIVDTAFYFDTDHLNADGVGALYRDHLLALIAPK
ncbi:hypothetical protein SAMN05444414_12062 [Roseovarius marisflavi]|uniref:SGNH/GDSL hydrolase family protein n=1 Tax=Roseovarius marisflavi TaxID=1054996 RepID=A0A1M7BRY1_9RHOB|nr:hypothetical protein [Roseovarius marisflavi]SHL57697.1 hypothetical protein SAMN05444414_12062 [Roseovarius marisflavi]